jgi:hypothetical protein
VRYVDALNEPVSIERSQLSRHGLNSPEFS